MAVNIACVGNVGKDPETHTFANGHSKTSFTLAVSQGYMDNSNWVDQGTMWFEVTPITKQATSQLAHIHKGDRILVTGLLSQRFWDKDGVQHSMLQIAAHAIGKMVKPQSDAQPQQAPTDPSTYGTGIYQPQQATSEYAPSSQPYDPAAEPWSGLAPEPDF